VKRAVIFLIIGAVIGGGLVLTKLHGTASKPTDEKPAAEKPAEDEGEKPTIARDTNGNVTITMSDETQADMGILVTNPASATFAPEMKGYGSVIDPAPLATLMSELASARVAYTASSNELARLKVLSAEENASARALQTAEATAMRDQIAVQTAFDRVAAWGKAFAERNDLQGFVQSLISGEKVLVRIDLPAGETSNTNPTGVRLVGFSGVSQDAEFFCEAASVDPQLQGRGYIFLVTSNATRLLPGEAFTGYLKLSGEPVSGAVIPRDAVVRTEGKGWVYVFNKDGESFTRKEIALDHPTDNGWFVTNGISSGDFVVVTGAQSLLSLELGESGFTSGRD
jgi:hypothetical protein